MVITIQNPAKTMESLREKAEAKSQKRIAKKNELAQSALTALAQLGFARAGLRDIASLSGVSLGVIHYYFEDKNELVSYAINLYKQQFVIDFDEVLSNVRGKENVINAIVEGLEQTIESKADVHRLWYDFRSQAMFDEIFHADVQKIEETLIELLIRHLQLEQNPSSDPLQLYIAVDGVFRYFIHRKLMGSDFWQTSFRDAMKNVLKCGLSGER